MLEADMSEKLEMTIVPPEPPSPGSTRQTVVASKLDLFFLGITIVIGGQYFSWNEGLQFGFIPYTISVALMSIAYFTLVLSLAEMTSTMPFSGGSYGFVRAAMGPFYGFVVGYYEAVLNIMYVASSVIPFGEMMTVVTGFPKKYEPLYWVLFFVTALYIHARRGKLFWGVNAAIAVASLLILLLFVFATLQYADIEKHALPYNNHRSTGGQVVDAFAGLPLSSWLYVGVEMLPLAAIESKQPRRDVPVAMTACMVYLFCSAVLVLFSVSCQEPGVGALPGSLLPLNYGFTRVFGISYSSATWLSLPAVYGTAFGFMYDYSRQLTSMSNSGLMPLQVPFQDIFEDAVLYTFLLLGSALGFGFMLIVYYLNLLTTRDLFLICMMGGYLVYVCVLISYVIFCTRYSTLHREFRSPLGISGAVAGMVIFVASFFSGVALQKDQVATVFVIGTLILVSAYYFLYAKYHQKFSRQEQDALFAAYIINANLRMKAKNRRGSASSQTDMRRSRASLLGSFVGSLFPFPWPVAMDPALLGSASERKNKSTTPLVNPVDNQTPFEGADEKQRKAASVRQAAPTRGSPLASKTRSIWPGGLLLVRRGDARAAGKITDESSLDTTQRDVAPLPSPLPQDAPAALPGRPLLERHFLWDEERVALKETPTLSLFVCLPAAPC